MLQKDNNLMREFFIGSLLITGLALTLELGGCAKKHENNSSLSPEKNSVTTMEKQVQVHPQKLPVLKKSEAPINSDKKPSAPIQHCFTFTYHHKTSNHHANDEDCSQHKNRIKLAHPDLTLLDLKSLCVRVNGIPVVHQVLTETVKKNQFNILIGAVAGPSSTITARICQNGPHCKENCVPPKDIFMESIAGIAEPSHAEKWELSNADLDPEQSDPIKELDPEVLKELSDASVSSVFEDWIRDSEIESCGQKGV